MVREVGPRFDGGNNTVNQDFNAPRGFSSRGKGIYRSLGEFSSN